MGEREPFGDFASTHGMCERCLENDVAFDETVTERTRPIRELHTRLTEIAISGRVDDVTSVIHEGSALGLGAIELLVAVLQPALHRVGTLWERGRVTPLQEARLTRFCAKALVMLGEEQRERLGGGTGAPVILLGAPGNAHSLGLEMLAFSLREAGRDVRAYLRAPAIPEVVRLCEEEGAAAIGLSVALVDQLADVRALVDVLSYRLRKLRIVIGGRAASSLEDLPASVVRWTGQDSLLTAPALFAVAASAKPARPS